jgi:hypothetical protein
LIAPAPDDLLEVFAVSSAVNRASNDGPALIVPGADAPPAEEETPKPKRAPRRKADAGDDGQGNLF